jgi:hypothetical protein
MEVKEVPCLRLDTWANSKKLVPTLLWIDVQGVELQVLQGSGDLLSQVSAVFVEAATKEIYQEQALKDDIIRFMESRGFRLLWEQPYWEMESYFIFVNGQLSHLGFPCYQEWLGSVCHPQDAPCRNESFHKAAQEKYELTKKYQLRKIVEIGVRLGYSAHAFLCGSPIGASYLGYDIVGGNHGGTTVAGLEYPEKILQRDFPKSAIQLVKLNTQTVNDLGISGVDFFHVDGDHSYRGAYHDMELAWKSLRAGGIMVVDDYDFLPPVKKAIDYFIANHQEELAKFEHLKTFRGDMVMVKK